ncbi:MAG TPA: response regulator transcription factor [Bacteriovoracaceae bacterium]|nr:response regulator transcription factor [Bacteriovoracaceae bacterium]
MTTALIVSNDKQTRSTIHSDLTQKGFQVHSVTGSDEAWVLQKALRFDLILVDLSLDGESGLAFYKALRQIGYELPVIMLGEGELDEFILEDFSQENCDFILKPFHFNELESKINSSLTASSRHAWVESFGKFKVDTLQQLLIFKDKFFHLTKVELNILLILAQRSGTAVHPRKISKLLKAQGMTSSMTTFYYVSGLRKKLEDYGSERIEISFKVGEGYRLTHL